MLIKWSSQNNPFKNLDPLLVPRAMKQLGEEAEAMGVKPVSSIPGGIRVDTRGVRSSAELQAWLEHVGAVLVTAEVSDLACLCDRKMTPEALGMMRHFPQEHFTDPLPDELRGRIREAYFGSYDGSEVDDQSEIGQVQIKQIEADFKSVGLELPEDRTHKLEESLEKPSDVSPEFLADFTETNPFQMPEDSMGLI
jgi:hypothetical protein